MWTNNARTETMATSWTYRFPWQDGKRCLIPCDSYDEPNASESLQAEIVAADDARIAAILKRDRQSMDAMFSARLIYVHASGREEQYIGRMMDGTHHYRAMVATRLDVQEANGMAIVNSDNDIDVVVGGALRRVSARRRASSTR